MRQHPPTFTPTPVRTPTPCPARATPGARRAWCTALAGLVLLQGGPGGAQAADTSPAQQLERFSVQAAVPAQAERGRVFFTSRHGGEWSCASCRKHRQIDPAVWKLASVKSAANCAACHTTAERGDFDDDRLKYPAGMDTRMRRSFGD